MVTLVTGGASGLGRATAARFAYKGSKVVFCDLPTSDGEKVAQEIGENATFIPADVTNEEEVQQLLAKISDKHGRLDVLVNCAGIAKAMKVFDFNSNKPAPLEEIERILTVCEWTASWIDGIFEQIYGRFRLTQAAHSMYVGWQLVW